MTVERSVMSRDVIGGAVLRVILHRWAGQQQDHIPDIISYVSAVSPLRCYCKVEIRGALSHCT